MSLHRFLLICALLVVSGVSVAATLTANSSIDAPDNNPGDGLCRSDLLPPSTCTLRAAIMEANALAGSHIINLQPGRVYTLTRSGVDDSGLNGDLDINNAMSIRCLGCAGNRAVVNANGVDRAFEVFASNVKLSGFDITGGRAMTETDAGNGGAVRIDDTAANVELEFMRLHDNRGKLGGALSNLGPSTTVVGTEFYANGHAVGDGPDFGSAIYNRGWLWLRNSAVYNNGTDESFHAAIQSFSGFLHISDSTISNNSGIIALRVQSNQTELRGVTITGNRFGISVPGDPQSLLMRNSIVASNRDGDCTFAVDHNYSLDNYNISPSVGCRLAAGFSNQVVAPRLTPMIRRQGRDWPPLHWPRVNSPALNAGAPLLVGDTACSALDQNAELRPQAFNGPQRCDVGAAEVPSDAIFYESFEEL